MNPSAIKEIVMDGHSLTLESFVAVARYGAKVELAPSALEAMKRNAIHAFPGVGDFKLRENFDACRLVAVLIPREHNVGTFCQTLDLFGINAGMGQRFGNALRKEADAEAGLHQLHGHGRIATLTDDIGREAAALTLLEQRFRIAPQVVAPQQAHGNRNLKACAGAGFLVALTGDIMTMPGLPKVPAAEKIDVDENGVISGLF